MVLVAHSYGGFVITNAATGARNVKALVYVDAFIPDEGQPAVALVGAESALAPGLTNPGLVFKVVPIPGAPPNVVDTYLLPNVVAESFANDVSAEDAALIAATQRPASIAGLAEPSGRRPGRTSRRGRSSAPRIGSSRPIRSARWPRTRAATVREVDASHVSMVSRPDVVVEVIERPCARSSAPASVGRPVGRSLPPAGPGVAERPTFGGPLSVAPSSAATRVQSRAAAGCPASRRRCGFARSSPTAGAWPASGGPPPTWAIAAGASDLGPTPESIVSWATLRTANSIIVSTNPTRSGRPTRSRSTINRRRRTRSAWSAQFAGGRRIGAIEAGVQPGRLSQLPSRADRAGGIPVDERRRAGRRGR